MKKNVLLALLFGSFLYSAAQLPNSGFEEWDSASVVNGIKVYNPMDWFSRNAEMIGIGKTAPVSLTTDAHSGKYAVKITSVIDDNDKYAGMLASGYSDGPAVDQLDRGEKFKLTGRIESYSGWYKYTPASELDSFIVMLRFYLKGQGYGSAYFKGGATSEYKQFVWQLSYPSNIQMPDSAKFLIVSSSYEGNDGTTLILDDLSIQYKATSGQNALHAGPTFDLYPNPVSENVTLFGLPPKVRSILLANSMGSVVKEVSEDRREITMVDLPSGIYWLTVIDEQGASSTQKISKM